MRSTTSSSDLLTILKDNFKKYWTIPALGLVWYFLWGLIPALLGGYSGGSMSDLAGNENFGYVLAILILAVPSGMAVFSYLQNPSAANYVHSLPISRGKLFAANLLSGLLMIAGPILVNGILMSLLAGSGVFVKWMIVTFISCFAIYAITVFAAMVSGNVLMHLFNAAFFNGFVCVGLLAFYMVFEALLYGYTHSDHWDTILLSSNALTAFITNEVSRSLMCVLYVIAGLVALLIAWICYRRRPIERTGESLVFFWVRGVLFLYCIFFGSLLFGLVFSELLGTNETGFSHVMVIGMIIGALLIYVIGSLMIDRSAKIFTRRNLLPAAVALVLAFGLAAGLGCDVTGYSSKIPAADEVKAVYVEPNNTLLFAAKDEEGGGYDQRWNAKYYNTEDMPIYRNGDMALMGMTDIGTINDVQDLHRALLEQDRNDREDMGSIRIIYDLKNGKRVQREFGLYYPNFDSEDLDANVQKAAQAYYESAEVKEKYSPANLKPEIFGSGTATYYPDYSYGEDGEIKNYPVPRGDMLNLQAALAEDYRDCTYEDAQTCKACVAVTPPGSSWEEILFPIPQDAKYTEAWVKKHKDKM